jgi:succinoglycan biosynthesis protein ExoA
VTDDALPAVSVIIPMYQERDHIGPCIDGFLAQTYPAERLEILVVDGGSTDGSRDVVCDAEARDPRVRLVENPRRLAAAAANEGIAAAHGDVLCFLSAHGVPEPTYVEASVRLLLETGAAGVGGRYLHEGTDATSRAIGLAMASPFGMASPHRTADARCEVDTISHPTFWKSALVAVGGYDETLHRNEDYELNMRVRRQVGPLVFSPEIRSVYRPRGSLVALARQFYAYGLGKAQVLRRQPDAVQPRHLVPPAFVASLAVAPLLCTTRRGRRVVALSAVAYAAVVGAAAMRAEPWRHDGSTAAFVAAVPTMHVSWGAGLLRGLAGRSGRR